MIHSTLKMTIIAGFAASSLSLGGCAQIGQAADGVWSGTKSVANFAAKPFKGKDELRITPEQAYAFWKDETDAGVEVVIYDTPETTEYAGYDVELYDTPELRTGPAASYAVIKDPREAAFVKLNGESQQSDWRNCETVNRGYLYIAEDDFRIDPKFEVCMRNKGYVLSTEAGPVISKPLTASGNSLAASVPSAYGYQKVNSYP